MVSPTHPLARHCELTSFAGDPAFTANVTELQKYYLTDSVVKDIRTKIVGEHFWLAAAEIRGRG